MPSFYYFLPGKRTEELSPPGLKHLITDSLHPQLQHVLSDRKLAKEQTILANHLGPASSNGSTESGVILIPKPNDGTVPRVLTYNPDIQTWVKVCNGAYWLGCEHENPPQPEDYERSVDDQRYCYVWTHPKTNQSWKLPIIHSPQEERVSIDHDYTYDEDGNFELKVRQQYQKLWEQTADIADYLKELVTKSHQWKSDTALAILQLNYRITKAEVLLLNKIGHSILDENMANVILAAACDWELVQDQKKTEELVS